MTEYAYTQNDNEIKVQFQEEGAAKDLSSATKIEIQLFASESDPINRTNPTKSFNSIDDSTLFDITDLVNGNLTFKPDSAALTTLTAKKYFGRFIVFSGNYPNGIVWAKGHNDLFDFVVSR